MSIKIDPETDKAVDPESIGKNDITRLACAFLLVVISMLGLNFFH